MQEFPLSKLRIKIHGINNPTSVFKKKSFLKLDCIRKTNKSKTPLRIFTHEELPHYMLPIKCQLNKTETYDKNQIKLKAKKSNINLPILNRNKSYNEIKEKQTKDDKNNNKGNNIYNTINFNKNNLNTNIVGNAHLNDYSSSNKDNNEKIISELNIINQNNNNNNNTSFEEPSFQSLISELQKKISEQNILLSTRNKEIEKLKKQLNDNTYNNIIDKSESNNKEKILITELEEQIKAFEKEIEILNNKYQTELNDKIALEEKYQFLKNSMQQQKDIKNYEDKIIQQENKIIALEDELNEMKNKKIILKISNESNFEMINSKNSETVKNFILNEKQFNDIQLILNVLLEINNLEKKNLIELINSNTDKNIEIDNNPDEICKILKIAEKDKNLINQFIKDLLLKSEKENNNLETELENLFKYKYDDINNKDINKKNLVMNSKNKKIIFERCKIYDYKNKHKIPFYYFKHLFKEICYINQKPFSSIEFFNLLYECKKFNGNEVYSLYDIVYENLIENENSNNSIINNDYELKYPEIVKNFLDKIIKEAFDKKKENFGNNQLNRARSFERDFFEQDLLDNNINYNNNKFNKDKEDD